MLNVLRALAEGASTSGAASQPTQQLGARHAPAVHPIVQYGCSAGFFAIVASIAVGAYGSVAGRRELYSRMLRYRLVLVGTTLGLYTTGTGFLPVPAPIVTLFGPPTRPPPQ